MVMFGAYALFVLLRGGRYQEPGAALLQRHWEQGSQRRHDSDVATAPDIGRRRRNESAVIPSQEQLTLWATITDTLEYDEFGNVIRCGLCNA